nr:hypothetical protein [Pseudomonas benzenivorans]
MLIPITSACYAPLPDGVIYKEIEGPAFFLKDYALTFPKVRVGEKQEWCVEGVKFHNQTPSLNLTLTSPKAFNPRESTVNAALSITNSTGTTILNASGLLKDPCCHREPSTWASQYFHYSNAPKTTNSVRYEVMDQYKIDFDKEKMCMSVEISTTDTAMQGAEAHIEFYSGWK